MSRSAPDISIAYHLLAVDDHAPQSARTRTIPIYGWAKCSAIRVYGHARHEAYVVAELRLGLDEHSEDALVQGVFGECIAAMSEVLLVAQLYLE